MFSENPLRLKYAVHRLECGVDQHTPNRRHPTCTA